MFTQNFVVTKGGLKQLPLQLTQSEIKLLGVINMGILCLTLLFTVLLSAKGGMLVGNGQPITGGLFFSLVLPTMFGGLKLSQLFVPTVKGITKSGEKNQPLPVTLVKPQQIQGSKPQQFQPQGGNKQGQSGGQPQQIVKTVICGKCKKQLN